MRWLFPFLAAVALTIAVMTAAPRAAAPEDELPEGEGKKILVASCTSCHDLSEVTKFRGYYDRRQWRVRASNRSPQDLVHLGIRDAVGLRQIETLRCAGAIGALVVFLVEAHARIQVGERRRHRPRIKRVVQRCRGCVVLAHRRKPQDQLHRAQDT